MSSKYHLISVNSDAKTIKGNKYGYLTGILYLAPAKLSGWEVCPSRSQGCTDACLNTSGRGAAPKTQNARIRRTQLLFNNREEFMFYLKRDIELLALEAKKQGLQPCIRLNGTSDLAWEGLAKGLMKQFPDIHFYDYTKVLTRMIRFCEGKLPTNYHLTFSRSESNWDDCKKVLTKGGNVAVVFAGKELPNTYEGYDVTNGDLNDLRFLDKSNVIVGLIAKGKGRKDTSGFVV